jgi:hyperosmotically inducible periplasmic protein
MTRYFLAIALITIGTAFAQNDAQPLAKDVRRELVMLPLLNVFDNLSYRIEGNEVTLMGYVSRPMSRTDAERAVERIGGVEKVDNQIEILPLSPHDDRLRQRLYRAIYEYPSLNRYAMPVLKPIRIIVKNGQVTLEGIVANQTDRDLVGIRANGVHGVFSVTNNLDVEKQTVGFAPLAPVDRHGLAFTPLTRPCWVPHVGMAYPCTPDDDPASGCCP